MKNQLKPLLWVLSFVLSATSAEAVDLVKYGFGLSGVVGYNWNTADNGGVVPEAGGLRTGFGLAFDLRVLEVVGLEANLIRSSDRGQSSVQEAAAQFVAVGQDAWHVPVLLKVVLPLPLVRPLILGGVDFVVPGSCTLRGLEVDASCQVKDYSSWTAGLGAEILLPIPGIDIRIPASVRYSGLLAAPKETDATEVRTEWDNDLYAMVGIGFFF
jgi:hypothetical protein